MLQHQCRKTSECPGKSPRSTSSFQKFQTELTLIIGATQKTGNENMSLGIVIKFFVNQIAQAIC